MVYYCVFTNDKLSNILLRLIHIFGSIFFLSNYFGFVTDGRTDGDTVEYYGETDGTMEKHGYFNDIDWRKTKHLYSQEPCANMKREKCQSKE